jgi:hypothetical protein
MNDLFFAFVAAFKNLDHSLVNAVYTSWEGTLKKDSLMFFVVIAGAVRIQVI